MTLNLLTKNEKKLTEDAIIERLLVFLSEDLKNFQTVQGRQACVWRREEPDYLPLCLIKEDLPEEFKWIPSYNMKEQFYDFKKMFIEGVKEMLKSQLSQSDSIPSIRVNTGVGTLATMIGIRSEVFEDKMPWVREHMSKMTLSKIEPDNIGITDDFQRSLDYMKQFVNYLKGKVDKVFCCDVQGPFSIAHIVYGDQIFYDLHDDPSFVHHLLNLADAAIIRGVKLMKEINGETLDTAFHYNYLYAERGGIKVSEDTTTLLSPKYIDEFALPHLIKVLKEFGGGWIHYCGINKHMLRSCMEIPEVSGINLGNPELHDYEKVIHSCLKFGKTYVGAWNKLENETNMEFFKRILQPLSGQRKGIILLMKQPRDDRGNIYKVWRDIQ